MNVDYGVFEVWIGINFDFWCLVEDVFFIIIFNFVYFEFIFVNWDFVGYDFVEGDEIVGFIDVKVG